MRITPVKDAIQPRYKIEGCGQVFPGMVSDVESVGEGKTLVLEGAAVVTCGRIVGFQEGIVDMSGKGSEYTPFSKTCNVVLVFEPQEGIEVYAYEKACRLAGLKAAMYLAKCVYESGGTPDKTETYEIPPFTRSMNAFRASQGGVPLHAPDTGAAYDTYVYGIGCEEDTAHHHPS